MNYRHHSLSATAALVLCVAATQTQALEYDFYGSLRIHGEVVQPDHDGPMDSYTGLRDAYSRIGFNVSHELTPDLTAYGKLELPFDSANLAVQDPWDQSADIRVGKIGLKGTFGNLAIGQMWMPYYNAIAYPVDMFSSYYSGFATFTTFRKGDTLAYYTPTLHGFSGAAAYSLENGALDSDGDQDDRWQLTLSYNHEGITVSAGVDHLGGINDYKIWGASLMWQVTDALYVGAKYEVQASDIDVDVYGADGDTAMNLYAGYTLGKHTFKGMVADVDNYGELIVHLGYDFQFNDDLKFFAEYYNEEETAAITSEWDGMNETCWACDGGQVFALGLRYDFGAP